jgi:crotonobetainyl-CoA:carnitine CoA-transferase CaiB-like acyl-CoA transferase
VQVADLGGGMLAALGILAGVLAARASGVGRYVDASMFDLVASLLGAHAVPCYWASGQVPGREGLPLTGLVPCYRVYQTKDGKHMALGAIEPKFWLAFCRAAGREDLQAAQYDPEAVPVVRQLFLTRTRLEWQALLAGVETCCEPVLDLDEALDGEQMVSRGLVQPLSDAPGLRVVGSPLVMGGTGAAPSPPPRLGEHTTELLRDVGYSDAAIEDMAAQGAVAV